MNGAGRDPRVLALAVLAATGSVYCAATVPPYWIFLGLLAGCALRFPGRALVAVALIAAAWTAWNAQRHLDRRLPVADDGKIVWVTGHVTGLAEHGPFRTRFVLDAEHPARRLRLSWYTDPPALKPGACLRVRAKLHVPHGSANPGLFDYEAWLWRHQIDATGYVREAGDCDRPPRWTLDRLRADILARLQPVLADTRMRGLIEALAFGVRTHITDDQWRVLRRTGTSHLVAISGLHIGLIAGWLFVLVRWLALRLPGRRWSRVSAAIAAFLGAMAYAALAGWALPTQRALVMTAAGLLAVSLMRRIAPARMLAFAVIIVVVWQPDAVIAPGFWLSFGAVAWLIYLAQGMAGGARWQLFLRLQLGLVLGLLPLTLWFFGQASLIAPLVNAVLIPLAAVVVPGVLLAVIVATISPALGAPLVHGIGELFAAGWPGLVWLSQWPLAAVHVAVPGWAALALALAGAALVCAPRGVPGRACGIILLLPALIGWQPAASAIAHGGYRLTVLDVGQGQAVVVRTHAHTLVFDAGPAYRTGFDAGAMIVAPYLIEHGRARIDRLVLSHSDTDHAGGASALADVLAVKQRLGALSDRPCRAGQRWRWDGVDFRFVYPSAAEAAAAETDNARSCMLRVDAPGGRSLLTGDIEAPSESLLLARVAPAALDSDVLLVAHHGSATSSSAAFLRAVSPRWALISSGWHNRWGFPAAVVTARLARAGARIYNTAHDGALTVTVADGVKIAAWRAQHRRFWQSPPHKAVSASKR